jgi:hypothetical protein
MRRKPEICLAVESQVQFSQSVMAEHTTSLQAQYSFILIEFQSFVNEGKSRTAGANDDIVKLAMVQYI